jgi:L-alanine-DL-glutamate epimerase-like enolase superfamily enzyme
MHIVKSKVVKNDIRLAKQFSYSLASLEHLPYILVSIETDQGIAGYGEAAIGWDTTGEVQEGSLAIFKLIEPLLAGKRLQSIEDIELVMTEINKCIYSNTALKSGVEFALLDALGKLKKVPVYELAGGKKLDFVIPQKVFSFENQELEIIQDKIRDAFENGVKLFKFKTGEKIDPLVILLQALSRINPQYSFVLDVNQGWINFSRAMEKIKKLEQFNIAWIEQPIYHHDFAGLAQIRSETRIPIMVDESCHSLVDLENLHLRGAMDYVNIKLAKCGGILEAKKLMQYCEKNGIGYMLGSMINSSLGVASDLHAATLGNLLSQDLTFPDRVAGDKFTGIKYEGYKAYIPQSPGLGVELIG